MILGEFLFLNLHKLEPRLCSSSSEDLELLKGPLLTEFLETSVLLKFFVEIS